MAKKKEELQNDELQVVVNKKPNCLVELSVTALPPLLEKARNKGFKEIQKEIEVPGFRKGKAPKDMVQKKYGSQIEERSKKALADLAVNGAFNLSKLSLLNQNSKIDYKLDSYDEKEAKLTFTFETEPVIPAIDPKGFTLEKIEEPKIGKKELDEAKKQMLLFYAKWTPVTDRGAQEGDYIIIDLETIEEPKQKVFSDTRFEVSKSHMADWMKKLVLGKEAGAVLEGVSEKDKNSKDEEEFEPKKVKLTIKKIESAEIPKLDDEFAKKVGSESAEKLLEQLEAMLKQKAFEKVDQEKREKVNRHLIDNHKVELPRSLIDSEVNHRKKQMEQNPRYQEQYKKMDAKQKEAAEKLLEKEATEAVSLFYISRQIVRDQKIPVTESEVQAEAMRTLQAFGPVNIDPKNIPQELFALALSKVLLYKAQNVFLEAKSA